MQTKSGIAGFCIGQTGQRLCILFIDEIFAVKGYGMFTVVRSNGDHCDRLLIEKARVKKLHFIIMLTVPQGFLRVKANLTIGFVTDVFQFVCQIVIINHIITCSIFLRRFNNAIQNRFAFRQVSGSRFIRQA